MFKQTYIRIYINSDLKDRKASNILFLVCCYYNAVIQKKRDFKITSALYVFSLWQ